MKTENFSRKVLVVRKKVVPLHPLSGRHLTSGLRERSLRDLHKQRQVVQEARVAAAPLSLGRRETVNKFFLFAFCSMNDGCRPVFRSDRACRPVFPAGISRIHFYSEEFDPGSG